MDKTLFIYTDINKTNGAIGIFAHMLTSYGDGDWEDVDYGRKTFHLYESVDEAVNAYIEKYVGKIDDKTKIVTKKM